MGIELVVSDGQYWFREERTGIYRWPQKSCKLSRIDRSTRLLAAKRGWRINLTKRRIKWEMVSANVRESREST